MYNSSEICAAKNKKQHEQTQLLSKRHRTFNSFCNRLLEDFVPCREHTLGGGFRLPHCIHPAGVRRTYFTHGSRWIRRLYQENHSILKNKIVMRNVISVLPIQLLIILAINYFTATSGFAQAGVSQEQALARLKEGNKRFVSGKSSKPRQDATRIKEVAEGQSPFATIVGCSDSRVPNEIIFDQGLGDLFIVRTAGQVSTYASWGSIEFAEEVLGTKLIVVLGHTKCGAVNAAVNIAEVPGHIVTLINAIKPAVEKARKKEPAVLLDAAIRENILMQVELLKGLEPVLAKRVREGSITIIGALYDLNSGTVEFLE
jgi:carbonic anhydrase